MTFRTVVEEEREYAERTKDLKEKAEVWSGLGNIENYRRYETKDDQIAIGYEPPKPLPEATQERAARTAESLNEQHVLNWGPQILE